MWPYDYACRCILAGTVIKCEAWGILNNIHYSYNIYQFLGEFSKFPPYHRNTVQQNQKQLFLAIFRSRGLKIAQTKHEVCLITFVGGFC